ncbi:unnamed protein product [Periconia digitata]|uniref:Uncharacterized protein n=1 Tax=Periconia digitata TaxID=1303443 RepID=A0A9W4UF25_9PLEO|nr:unnamed protein product [Periconia digitata]
MYLIPPLESLANPPGFTFRDLTRYLDVTINFFSARRYSPVDLRALVCVYPPTIHAMAR